MTTQNIIIERVQKHGKNFKNRDQYREIKKNNTDLPSVSSIEREFFGFANFMKQLNKSSTKQIKEEKKEYFSKDRIKKWREAVLKERIRLFKIKQR